MQIIRQQLQTLKDTGDIQVPVTVKLDEGQFDSLVAGLTGEPVEVPAEVETPEVPDVSGETVEYQAKVDTPEIPDVMGQEVTYTATVESPDLPDIQGGIAYYTPQIEDSADGETAEGTINYDKGTVESADGETSEGIINYDKGDVEKADGEISTGTINYDLGTVAVPTGMVATGTINYALGTVASPGKAAGTFGQARAFAKGSLTDFPAYGDGRVSLPNNQRALVNEEYINGHSESIVHDGVWSLIPGGAHMENLKKGDMIFSAQQTEDLLKSGATPGHARAYARGSLGDISLANAFGSGFSGTGRNPWVNRSTSSSSGSSSGSSGSSGSQQATTNNTNATNANTSATKSNTKATKINTIVAGVLSPCMKMAVEDNIIRNNPCINCRKEIRGEDTDPEDVLTTVQQDNFLTYIKNSKYAYYYPLFVFMLETALRVGEVCGLTWSDVDLEHGFVHITHQLQYTSAEKNNCQYQILTPKSKSGIRNVPVSNAAKDALMEQMQNQIEMDKKTEIEIDGYKDFVFSNRQSKPFITQTIGRILNRIVDDYNADIKKFGGAMEPLPHIHPHLLRHTSCSRMAEAGVDPRTLQDIMGHASMRMTMELYNHVTDERLMNEIQKLNDRRIS